MSIMSSSSLIQSACTHLPLKAPCILRQSSVNLSSSPISTSKPYTLKVRAGVGLYPASMRWWKKGEQLNNMREITSSEQFSDALSVAVEQDKLVLVDFYSTGCGSCKAIYPKIRQIAIENPNIEILKINIHENYSLCQQLKINKLKSAVEKYQGDQPTLSTS